MNDQFPKRQTDASSRRAVEPHANVTSDDACYVALTGVQEWSLCTVHGRLTDD